jgi:ribonuclease HI
MALIEIKFDGACHNKVGESSIMGIGIAVFFDNEYIEEESIAVQITPEYVRGTSNIAEWEGCVQAWRTALILTEKYPGNEIRVYSDSQVISRQFNGEYAINNTSFHSYKRIAEEYSNKIQPDLKVHWIRRELNKEADKLSKIGLKIGDIKRGELSN